MPGRFSLGVGSGENLNEHIVGDRWPGVAERQARLEEAIELIRKLWQGKLTSHRGEHFTVENARLYSLPEEPPPLLVAVAGESSVELAARAGDGIVGTAPVAESVEQFRAEGGAGKPTYGQLHVCWAEDEQTAKQLALKQWPNSALSGPDPERHRAAIQEYVDAGYDHVYIHQVGPDQEGFLDFYEREVLPAFA